MEYGQAFFLYIAVLKIADALTVLGVWTACWYLRFDASLFPITKGLPNYRHYAEAQWPLSIVFLSILHIIGAYRRDRIHFGFRSLKKVVQGSFLGTLSFISICYFLGEVEYSRLYLLIFAALVMVGLVVERAVLQGLWKAVETSFVKKIRILVLGNGSLLEMYLNKLEERKPYPVHWIGRLGKKGAQGRLGELPYLGSEERLFPLVQNERTDLVIVSYPTEDNGNYESLLESLSNQLVAVKVIPDFGKFSTFTYAAEQECGIPLLMFNQTPVGATDRALKRLLDLVGSLTFILFFSPLYLMLACLVKISSRGPVLYSQVRVGADGRVFTLYKFRSMREDAEVKTGAIWATANDSRTTSVGKWLRRTSLDELPQMFNVLKGDMSLVGPRPERPVFVDQFRKEIPKYMLRHKMKSGLTGWAQVNGWRGNTSIEERIKHDLYYIGHWSHYFDVKILCLTLIKGFVNRHAY